ncbi:MAG: IS66 family insertion sequence element accessory protein TnpB [Proteobacteria bacterium]|nr:IS66 family insertion sequence element accessory protein TnpB [Pseudomonadota bacterium]
MKDISAFSKIFLATQPVDFRKQANGLSVIVKEVLDSQPFEAKSLFVFINKKKSAIRMLYWDFTGFATWNKLLEKDRFKWPKNSDTSKLTLSSRQLKWLLQGVDLERIKVHQPLDFEKIF